MRKIFAGAMVFSVIGAVILGGTLAWNNTFHLGPYTTHVGSLAFSATFSGVGPNDSSLIGPNDGMQRKIGELDVSNSGDFNLRIDVDGNCASAPITTPPCVPNQAGSRVYIRSVDVGHTSCDTSNFVGQIRLTGVGSGGAGLVAADPPTTIQDIADVFMAVATNAPNACMGANVSYDIFVVAVTTGSSGTN